MIPTIPAAATMCIHTTLMRIQPRFVMSRIADRPRFTGIVGFVGGYVITGLV